MANEVFCNYRLRRTLPKLSGNMQFDIIVGVDKSKPSTGYVKQAHIRPISPRVNYVPIVDERIMDRPHRLNIKKFYEKTVGQFFSNPINPELGSDWPYLVSQPEMSNLKYLKNWDDTYWAGCKRMQHKLYGTTHECLVPVWIDRAVGLKFILKIVTTGGQTITSVSIDISPDYIYNNYNAHQKFHNDFVEYFLEYLKDIKITEGNNNVMSVDLKNNITILSGLQVESGNYVVRQNFNVARNLIWRERPLLESNSLLTNTFADSKLIVPQLMNFNFCFNVEEIVGSSAIAGIMQNSPYTIQTDVQVLEDIDWFSIGERNSLPKFNINEHEYVWTDLAVRDFYTNHDFVPRPQAKYSFGSGGNDSWYDDTSDKPWLNALDHLRDNTCSDIMHQNKMVQPICHWVHAEQPDGDLFNVYDGFGTYVYVGDKIVEYGHGFGNTTDPSVTEYDPSADNTIWAGPARIGDGDDIQNTLNAPQQWVDNGYFKDTSNFINGLKFTYDPSKIDYNGTGGRQAPSKVYIGTMKTLPETNPENWKTAATSFITSQGFIGILTERISHTGTKTISDLPKTRNDEYTAFDKGYDWHVHSDIDNRFSVKTKDGRRLYIDRTGEILGDKKYVALNDAGVDSAGKTWNIHALELVGGKNPYNPGLREYNNATALYVCMRRMHQKDAMHRPDDPLCVIFYHPQHIKERHSTSDGVIYDTLYPHGLTLGGVIQSLKDYVSKYGPMYDAIRAANDDGILDGFDPGQLPDMPDLEVVNYVTSSIEMPEVIYFTRSVIGHQDNSVSSNAREIKYFKLPNQNEYVWRYSGKIKPAIFEDKTWRQNIEEKHLTDHLTYRPTFGRNFLYEKTMVLPPYKQMIQQDIRTYLHKGVPPLYPSIGYDTVYPAVIESVPGGINKEVPKGDLMYNEPHPIYNGYTRADKPLLTEPIYKNYVYDPTNPNPDTYQTYEWFEYKWFDKSTALILPAERRFTIQTNNNDKKHLELAALEALSGVDVDPTVTVISDTYNKINQPLEQVSIKTGSYPLDFAYLRNVYDFEFILKNIEPLDTDDRTGQVLYTYIYEIIVTLK